MVSHKIRLCTSKQCSSHTQHVCNESQCRRENTACDFRAATRPVLVLLQSEMYYGKVVLLLVGGVLVVLAALDLLMKETTLLVSDSVVHEESSARAIISQISCARIAPCWPLLQPKNPCFDVYPQEFWRRNQEMAPFLHWQRLNSPRKWYENEFLTLKRASNASICREAPETLVYFHNFKAGGTTAHKVFHRGLPGYNVEQEHYGDTEKAKQFMKRSFDFAQQIYNTQQEHSKTVEVFTFVRHPVKRFLSGLAQIGRMNIRAETIDEASRKCFSLSGEALIVCVLDYIEDRNVFFNVHIYPQSYLMDTWSNWGLLDIRITVAHMDDMDALFTALMQGENVQHARESNANGVHDKTGISELSNSTIARICQAYRADLMLLQLMNFSDPLCPGDYSFDDAMQGKQYKYL